MEKYFFRFRAQSRLSFGKWEAHQIQNIDRVQFNFEPMAVLFTYDSILPTTPKTHFGLGFDVQVESETAEAARKIAESNTLILISILSFSEGCYIGKPELVSTYQIPNEDTKLKKVCITLIDENYAAREVCLRIIDKDRLVFLFKILSSINEEKAKSAVQTALHWFWKCLESRDARDRFLQLWIAFETLSVSLKDFYLIPRSDIKNPVCGSCDKEVLECPLCKDNIGKTCGTGLLDGYRKLAKEHALHIDIKALHSLRSRLIHTGSVDAELLRKSISSVHELIAKTIFVLSNSDPSKSANFPNDFKPASILPYCTLEGEIDIKRPLTINDIEKQPMAFTAYKRIYKIDNAMDKLIPEIGIDLIQYTEEFAKILEKDNTEINLIVDSSHKIENISVRSGDE